MTFPSPPPPHPPARGERGQNVLRELLGPLVKEVLNEKDLVLHTGPVDVYRAANKFLEYIYHDTVSAFVYVLESH